MNRACRRQTNKRKWLSLAKKYFYSCGYYNQYSSITEFLKKDSFAKLLKNTKTPVRKFVVEKLWIKQQNRKERHSNKIVASDDEMQTIPGTTESCSAEN